MVKKSFLFGLLLALLFPVVLSSQEMKSVRLLHTKVSGLLPPWVLLPEHVHSARVVPHLTPECKYFGISPDDVIGPFSLSAYPDSGSSPEVTVDVYIELLTPDPIFKSGSVKAEIGSFWYQTPIKVHLKVQMTDQTGHQLYTDERTVSRSFDAPQATTPQMAYKRWNEAITTPEYITAWRNTAKEAISRVSGALRERYDFQPENIALYYPENPDTAFMEQVKKTQSILLQINDNRIPDTLSDQWQALVYYYDSRMLQLKPGTAKQRPLYYACGMNLANMHRSLRQYEQARYYIRRLIDADFKECAPLASILAERLQHQLFLENYGHVGLKMEEYEQQTQKARLEVLSHRDEITGYIVLTNRQVVNGTFLHPLRHFQEKKVKVKYEKRLNDPIADREYSISEVREMHGEEWHLAFIEYGSNMYLSEIIWQSPAIFLARPMTGITLRETDQIILKNDWFIQKSSVPDVAKINLNQITDVLSGYLDDCPLVARRIKHGYYTARQAPDIVKDYSDTCPQEPVGPKSQSVEGKSPGFYLGYQTGYNNFTSVVGLASTFRLYRRLFARIGGGVGVWGGKFGAGLKYDMRRDMRYSKGWSYTLGYGYSTGTRSAFSFGSSSSSVIASQPVNSSDYYVTVQPLRVQTLNATAIFNKFYGARTVVQIELGYSVAMRRSPWRYDPDSINPKQSLPLLKAFSPGGLVLSTGIHWAL